MEMVTLNQCINSEALILGVNVAFSGNHEWNFTRLEIEINRGEGDHSCVGRVCSIVCTILGLDVAVEIAFGHAVSVDIR